MGLKSYIKRKQISLLIKIGKKNIISDESYLKKMYKLKYGGKLDLDNPITFNEKIQWLKLYNKENKYTNMVDKYEVKKYIETKIGKEYVIPLIGFYKSFDEIDFKKLPNQFVIKCTHDSGGVVICKDKNNFDINKAKRVIDKRLSRNFYYNFREYVYKDIPPRIIVEKYMEDYKIKELRDYKFFCFKGNPKLIQVDFNRFQNHKRNVYDLNWKLLDLEIHYPSDRSVKIKKPKNFKKMIDIAKKLSADIPFVRVDLYNVNGKIYFGELTFYHGSGYEIIKPSGWNKKLGDYIELPNKKNN